MLLQVRLLELGYELVELLVLRLLALLLLLRSMLALILCCLGSAVVVVCLDYIVSERIRFR